MKYLVTRASCDIEDWNEILEETDLDIKTLYDKYGRFIVSKNMWCRNKNNEEKIKQLYHYFKGVGTIERFREMCKCELEITIYDDYVE